MQQPSAPSSHLVLPSIILAVLASLAAATGAWAGPDHCVTQAGTAVCEGNQSQGVSLGNDYGAQSVTVRNLTSDITQPQNFAGILHFLPSASGASLNATFVGGDFGIHINSVNSFPGIRLGGDGADGANGRSGSNSAGGPGSAGTALSAGHVSATGTILTEGPGTGHHGILLDSKAGNGGAGGGGSLLRGGGDGGDGGGGATLSIDGSGRIDTRSNESTGIRVRYQAGNGGAGRGSNGAGSGGHGGNGGGGPSVLVKNSGDWMISTTGTTFSPGIRIDSVSGNGGNAGDGAGSGGHGGAGGAGGRLEIGTGDQGAWTLSTRGSDSAGLHMSSQAGQAGRAGSSGASASGAAGGSGGAGGDLVAWNASGGRVNSSTIGDRSPGLHLESLGGNGTSGTNGTFAAGGTAGNGGDGGQIALGNREFTARVDTAGNQSTGVLVISSGGDAGNGGSANVAGGGKAGGGGGAGGAITIAGTYTIDTSGAESSGIVAQTLGGKGGQGGDGSFFNPTPGGGGRTGSSGPVTVDVVGGKIETRAPAAFGIFAQSVAGHSGAAGTSGGLFTFSASGGSAGDGGAVSVTNGAEIHTHGDQSIAIAAESIGGGGGHGGSGLGIFGGKAGSGSVGGKGGKVSIDNSGNVTTQGHDAGALYAQSIGGTGGSGGVSQGFVALGGWAATGGDGGAVSVSNSGTIRASAPTAPGSAPTVQIPICGDGCSPGIFAQSIGGGGGQAGSAEGWFSVGGNGGGGGHGGAVDVTNSGGISTGLDRSAAIFAQSIGGGGGYGSSARGGGVLASVQVGGAGGKGGDGGAISVHSDGGLQTLGKESPAIHAQSVGGGGGHGGFADRWRWALVRQRSALPWVAAAGSRATVARSASLSFPRPASPPQVNIP